MKTKTATRVLAMKIQKITGESLIQINRHAYQIVEAGMFETREEALQYILFILTMNEEA